MGSITVGISDMQMARNAEDVLVTYALGSCVGLAIYDGEAGIGGMIHCMLPLSRIDPAKAEANPCMFVDTGVPLLFQTAYQMGARKERIVVRAAGGSRILDEGGHFKIGERNHATLRKILWKNNVMISGEDLGGSASRTMYLEMTSGRVTIRSGGGIKEI